jgi:hypothetical protein
MATRDDIKKNGTDNLYKNDRGKSTLITEPVIGVVKNNVDPTRSGQIFVYIGSFGGSNPDSKENWIPVRYMSPFMGLVGPNNDYKDGPDKSGYGKFTGNPQSYGFWASAPDLGTEVVCIFVNGRIDQGFYIGCIPKPGLLSMTPAIGATTNVVPNGEEATSYGGADRLPTSEVNYSNPSIRKSAQVFNEPKPVHSYQASVLSNQGLIRDNTRGVISSSAQRESPSRVFGISTPGGPIFEGGYTASTIVSAVKKGTDTNKLKIIGRTGGHSLVMDDGTISGADQLMRLRTSGGHQIMMNDSGQALFIIHSNGQTWIELGKEGTIDMYATNSFNVRSQGDLNLHADKNVNINAGVSLNLYGGGVKIESGKDMSFRAGANFIGYAATNYTIKAGSNLGLSASGEGGFVAGGTAFVKGAKLDLNGGDPSTSPGEAPAIARKSHVDTTFSKKAGWMNPAPQPLSSITSRAPAHQPWVGASVGAPVKVDPVAPPLAPASSVDTANSETPATPTETVSPAEIKAAPAASNLSDAVNPSAVTAMTGQVALAAQGASAADAAKAGVLDSSSGLTAKMAEAGKALLPGASKLATDLMAKGMPAGKALSGLMSGGGTPSTPSSLLGNNRSQAGIVQSVISSGADMLKRAGLLTGKESSAQSGGSIMAAATAGAGYVTGLLKKGPGALKDAFSKGAGAVSGMVGSLGNMFAGGKAAGGASDSMSFAGLKSSLSGLGDKALGGLSSLGGSLMSGMQTAFAAVETSFAGLTGGKPNSLGAKTSVAVDSAASKSGKSYDAAIAERESAEVAYLAAKQAHRNSGSAEDYATLQAAERRYNLAQQAVAQLGTTYIATAGSKTTTTKKSSTASSGTSMLPGGLKSLMATVTGAASSITSLFKKVGDIDPSTALADAQSLAGDMMGKASDAISSASNSVSGALDSATSSASGMMAELETGIGSLGGLFGDDPPVAATNTFDKASMTAKMGSLLGDPKIPVPVFGDAPVASADADEIASKSADAIVALDEARSQLNLEEVQLAAIFQKVVNGVLTEDEAYPLITSQQAKVDSAKESLASAEDAYSQTLA